MAYLDPKGDGDSSMPANRLAGEHGLGRSTLAPQSGQDRQRDRPVQKRQRDHDRRDHEGVTARQFPVAVGHLHRPVVAPVRRKHSPAATAKQGVVDGDHQWRADRHQMADDQPQHRKATVSGCQRAVAKNRCARL
jgi:hypothetical protein